MRRIDSGGTSSPDSSLTGNIGYLVAPLVGLAVFLLLPVFYAVTSADLYQFQVTRRITHRPAPPSG